VDGKRWHWKYIGRQGYSLGPLGVKEANISAELQVGMIWPSTLFLSSSTIVSTSLQGVHEYLGSDIVFNLPTTTVAADDGHAPAFRANERFAVLAMVPPI
jgi:hypothetical protein